MIITDSSVIEDLLTAFHYQQQTYNETERERKRKKRRRRGSTDRDEEESGGGGGGGDRCWGRLSQDGRVSEGIRQGREMGEEAEVEVVFNSERVRERFGEGE